MSSPRRRSPDGRYMKNKKNLGEILKDYGNMFTTKGSGKKVFNGQNVRKFLKKVLGNRMLDLYLKYIGITTLSTATLVPLGLILSKDYVDKLINNKKIGGFIPEKLPVIDNPIVGNYLKLAGLSMLQLSPGTLLPLGVVMIIYDLALKNLKLQIGGKITSNLGNSIPPNTVQQINGYLEGGQGAPLFDILKPNLQLTCANGACASNNIATPVGQHKEAVLGLGNEVSNVDIPGMSIKQATEVAAPVNSSNTNIPNIMTGGSSYTKIINPRTGRKVSIYGRTGKTILKNYVKYLNRSN